MSTRRRSDEDFDREIRAHLELETQRLIDDGMSPAHARAAAQRRFGNVTRVRERWYEARRTLWLDHLRQDVRCAMRNLRRYPVVALVAVASLAGGIGATTVTLTIRDVLFHKAPPLYREPGQLSRVQVDRAERSILPLGSRVPVPLYLAWREQLGPSIAASMVPRGTREVRAGDRRETAPVRGATSQLFAVLGVGPAAGTLFPAGPAPAGARRSVDNGPTPAVLSHRLWERLFDRRADAIGRLIWIDDQPHTVVGVMPERFWFLETNAPIWTPLDVQALDAGDRVEVIIRRPAGVTAAALDAQLQSGLAEFAVRQPADRRQWRLQVSGINGTALGHQVAPILLYVLGTSVLLTLLIACANVAILMIAQWTAREHEIAIRASIGASRGRIVRALLTESVLIAMIAGAAGLCATFALRGWVLSRAPAAVSLHDVSLDPSIFAWTAAITLLTGIAVGIAPALYETRRLHTNPLKAIGASDRVRQRWRHALVVVEISVTVGLLVQTVAIVGGWQRARSAQLGFDKRPLLSARLENPAGVPTGRLLEALAALPGVSAAAASTGVPFTSAGQQVTVGTDAGGANAVTAEQTRISAGYFVALGVPLRAGRVFAREDSAPVHTAIVNETLARRLLVAFHSLRLVGIGSALGIAVTLGLARVVRASGGGGTIFDPENAAFVFPLAIVLAIAAVATWIPSRRALKIDPAVLLRSP